MKRLALTSLVVLLSSPAIASSAIAFTERFEEGINSVRPTSSALGNGVSTQPTTAQTLPENVDCIKEGDTTALNDRFDEARRQNLDLALNDRFDKARRQNLDLALNERFDEARRRNLNS
jgi:ABC-type phosphate transport system auxiliary subunit